MANEPAVGRIRHDVHATGPVGHCALSVKPSSGLRTLTVWTVRDRPSVHRDKVLERADRAERGVGSDEAGTGRKRGQQNCRMHLT